MSVKSGIAPISEAHERFKIQLRASDPKNNNKAAANTRFITIALVQSWKLLAVVARMMANRVTMLGFVPECNIKLTP